MLLSSVLLAILQLSFVAIWNVECVQQGKKPKYHVVLSQQTVYDINWYKNALRKNKMQPGNYLKQVVKSRKISLNSATAEIFVELLLQTKKPRLSATQNIRVDGSDWNPIEFQILGDLNIAMDVTIYDNGVWSPTSWSFRVHNPPFFGTLLFTNGPLLESKLVRGMTPDLKRIISQNKKSINQDKYNGLMERRLQPLLYYANENARRKGKMALIVIPGVGAGVFAGQFKGKMGKYLNRAIKNILTNHAANLTNIACIYYDPYNECKNETKQFYGVSYRVRPDYQNPNKYQLMTPNEYREQGDQSFSNYKLYKVVAWSHVAYPGNGFFKMIRSTDDGVAAAATNSMKKVTGVKGVYFWGKYNPPSGYRDWLDVVTKKKITLRANENVFVVTRRGFMYTL